MNESPFSLFRRLLRKKNSVLLLVLLLLGLALLFLSFLTEGADEETSSSAGVDEAAYVEALEERTRALLSEVSGAGEVHVMLTMEHFGREEYATDRSLQEILQGSGSETSGEESVVLKTEKSGVKTPVVSATELSRVRGVSVVCSGGADAQVQKKIIGLLQALFDLKSNQISVTN